MGSLSCPCFRLFVVGSFSYNWLSFYSLCSSKPLCISRGERANNSGSRRLLWSFFGDSNIEITTYVDGQLTSSKVKRYDNVPMNKFYKEKDVNLDAFLDQPLTSKRLEELKGFIKERERQEP